MTTVRHVVVVLMAGALAFACDRPPTGVPQSTTLNPSPITMLAVPGKASDALKLVPCRPLPQQAVTQWIGPGGGRISVGPHTLLIPAGALTRTVAITAEIDSKSGGVVGAKGANAVRFKPKLQFETPAYLTMSYAHCELGNLAWLPKHVVYTNEGKTVIFEQEASVDSPDA